MQLLYHDKSVLCNCDDLFEAVAGSVSGTLSPGSLRSAGVTCISFEMLPTSPRPSQGVAWTLSPGSLRSAGATCISDEMPPTSPRPSQGISLMLSQARFARLLLASVSRCPDLFDAVSVVSGGHFPQACFARRRLLVSLPRFPRPPRGCRCLPFLYE